MRAKAVILFGINDNAMGKSSKWNLHTYIISNLSGYVKKNPKSYKQSFYKSIKVSMAHVYTLEKHERLKYARQTLLECLPCTFGVRVAEL